MNDILTDNNNQIKCPDCGSQNLQKYGGTKAGMKKYRCKVEGCRRQFVAGSQHCISSGTKEKVLKLLSDNVHPKIIHKTFSSDISLRWIFQLRRRMNRST